MSFFHGSQHCRHATGVPIESVCGLS